MSKGKSTQTAEIPEYMQRQQQEVFQAAKGISWSHHSFHTQVLELLDLIQINLDNFKPLAVYLKLGCSMTH
jgi:hypothetical protein